MADTDKEPAEQLDRVKSGDEHALAELFDHHRERLRRMVHFRLDARLRGRVDAEDVLQEAYLASAARLAHFVGESETEFFIWLRMVVSQTLIDVHRRHLGAQMRDAGREVVIRGAPFAQTTGVSLVANLLGTLTSPTQAARRAEMAARLQTTLNDMDPIDREVLALRHFEELSNSEVATELNIQQKAASIRYVRALRRLKDILAQAPGFGADLQDGL